MLSLLTLCLLAQDPSVGHVLGPVAPKRVENESPHAVASAQVGLGALKPVAGASTEGLELTFVFHGEDVRFTIERDRDQQAWTRLLAPGRREQPLPIDVPLSPSFDRIDLRPLGMPAQLMLYQRGGETRATLRTLYHHEATTAVAGAEVTLCWIDMDLDGRASLGDRWVALASEHFDRLRIANAMFLAHEGSEGWYFGDKLLIMRAGARQRELSLELRDATVPSSEFLRQRAARVDQKFWDGFDEGREQFLEQFEIEADRPTTATPLQWFYTHDFDAARAHAAKLGLPLYVELTSDGCPWCKRLSWLNYRDREVAEALRGYALVKLDIDLDVRDTAGRLGLKGVPKGLLFGAEDKDPQIVAGWMPPAEHAAAIRKAGRAVAR